MTLDCYEFYLWTIGQLVMPQDLDFETTDET